MPFSFVENPGIKGVIFDMNGTMVDDADGHRRAWIIFGHSHGIDITDERYSSFHGHSNKEILFGLFSEGLSDEQVRRYSEEKEATYRQIYTPVPMPGLIDLIHKCRERDLKVAIATTSSLENRRHVIDGLGLREDFFDVIVGEESVDKGKPDPEIYNETLRRLGLNTSEVVVFEDSISGVTSASRAGISFIVGVLTSLDKDALEKAGARFQIHNFTDVII